MNRHYPAADFKSAPPLSRKQLLRAEYDRSYRDLVADRDAGRISPQDASARFTVLLATYRQAEQELDLAGFLGSRGLGRFGDTAALDASLAKMAAEHDEGRVGDTPVRLDAVNARKVAA